MPIAEEQRALNLVYSGLIMGFSLTVILLVERIGLGPGPKINRSGRICPWKPASLFGQV